MIHDLSSLSLVHSSQNSMTIIVINNHGGGIFSFLPVAKFTHVFEHYFATPHDYSLKGAATMFNLIYFKPSTNQEFVETYKSCISGKHSSLIEVDTSRDDNYSLHLEIQNKIKSTLEK